MGFSAGEIKRKGAGDGESQRRGEEFALDLCVFAFQRLCVKFLLCELRSGTEGIRGEGAVWLSLSASEFSSFSSQDLSVLE